MLVGAGEKYPPHVESGDGMARGCRGRRRRQRFRTLARCGRVRRRCARTARSTQPPCRSTEDAPCDVAESIAGSSVSAAGSLFPALVLRTDRAADHCPRHVPDLVRGPPMRTSCSFFPRCALLVPHKACRGWGGWNSSQVHLGRAAAHWPTLPHTSNGAQASRTAPAGTVQRLLPASHDRVSVKVSMTSPEVPMNRQLSESQVTSRMPNP